MPTVPRTLVKETAASRAVDDLPANLASAGVPADTAQALSKFVKEYLAYPMPQDRALRELIALGLSESSAIEILQSLKTS